MQKKKILKTEKFLNLRTEQGMNREHLAVRLGLSASAVQTVETCPEHNPSIQLVVKYLEYFNVTVKDLIRVDNINLGDAV